MKAVTHTHADTFHRTTLLLEIEFHMLLADQFWQLVLLYFGVKERRRIAMAMRFEQLDGVHQIKSQISKGNFCIKIEFGRYVLLLKTSVCNLYKLLRKCRNISFSNGEARRLVMATKVQKKL